MSVTWESAEHSAPTNAEPTTPGRVGGWPIRSGVLRKFACAVLATILVLPLWIFAMVCWKLGRLGR
jgi:hypothetical protein